MSSARTKHSWITEGFQDFVRGSFGNGGQNLYVSRAGILQRIHQFDFTGNGFVDLVFCNSQSHFEKPDARVLSDPLGESRYRGLRSHGCRAAAVADLNGDGYDDLILGSFKDGLATDLNAMIYYGSPGGLTENFHIELPAPGCTAVATGDFDGDGKIDIAFLTRGRLRLFYQTPLGFELKKFQDLDLEGQQLDAFDLDGNGYADLLVRFADGSVSVFWGGADGIQPERETRIPLPEADPEGPDAGEGADDVSEEEFVADADPLVRVVLLDGQPVVFCPSPNRVILVPVGADRTFLSPSVFAVRNAYSIAIGDVNGNGHVDLVFAAREVKDGTEYSWVYWGNEDGYSDERRDRLPSSRAADVAVGDLNANGRADILIVQNRSLDSFTTESLIYRGTHEGFDAEPIRLESHDARRGFIARTSDENTPQAILTSNFARSASDDLNNVIYFGSENGFSPDHRKEIAGWGAFNALYADLNDDGLPDLVSANGAEFSAAKDPGSFVFYNRADGLPECPDQVLPTSAATVALCADLDRNGYLDLVFCGYRRPEIVIFPGGPDGFEVQDKVVILLEVDGVPYGFLFSLFLVDLNANGWLDLVVGGGNEDKALILFGGPDGYSLERCQVLATYIPRSITAADLNGNGYPDLIFGARKPQLSGPHDAFLYVYWNGPEGLRDDRRTMLPVKSTNGLAVGDFNNDGMLDIFAGSYADGRERDLESYIYWNRPGRGFTLLDRLCLQTHAVGGCLAADFNEDGWLDLAVTNHKVLGDHKGNSEVWWNGPDGFNVSRTTELPTLGGRGPSLIHPGNILDRGPEEFYLSQPRRLPENAVVEGLTWEGAIPRKTWVKGQVRVADREEDLALCAWTGPGGGDSSWVGEGTDSGVRLPAGWVQYRLALGATNGCSSPRLTAVIIHYSI